MALQQAAGIAIDTAPLSRLQWGSVSPSLRRCPRCSQNPYKHTTGQSSLSQTEVGGRAKQMSSSTETRSALPTLQKHAERPSLEDPPCMCRRSAFSSSLLDQHSSPYVPAWFIGFRCRVSASVQRNSYSQYCPHQRNVVSKARHQPSTLHVPALGSIGIFYQGLLP